MNRRKREPFYTGQRLTPYSRAFVEAIAERPMTRLDAITLAAKHVPPGKAIRRFQRQTRGREHPIETPEAMQVISGSRWIVMDGIRQMEIAGRIEYYMIGETEMVRLTDLGRQKYLGITKMDAEVAGANTESGEH